MPGQGLFSLISCVECGTAKLRRNSDINRAAKYRRPMFCDMGCAAKDRGRKQRNPIPWLHRDRERRAGRPCPMHCEVCGGGNSGKRLHFDHDHKTGEFRAWLCGPCNRVLGLVHDSPDRLEALSRLLRRHPCHSVQ